MLTEITGQAADATRELLAAAGLSAGDMFVVGCSSSEVAGRKIGTFSSSEVAEAVFAGIYPLLKERGIYLAAQCCEHLNRALILEREAAQRYRQHADRHASAAGGGPGADRRRQNRGGPGGLRAHAAQICGRRAGAL